MRVLLRLHSKTDNVAGRYSDLQHLWFRFDLLFTFCFGGGYFITIFAIEKSCFVTTRDIRRPCAPIMLAEQE